MREEIEAKLPSTPETATQIRKILEKLFEHVDAQKAYIDFLVDASEQTAFLSFTHGFKYPSEFIERGKLLREKLKTTTDALSFMVKK